MRKIKELVVKVSQYTNRNGETKTNWKNIGGIFEGDDGGKFILLDRTFNPAGVPNPENRDSLMVSIFEVKEKEQQAQQAPSVPADYSDDIPF